MKFSEKVDNDTRNRLIHFGGDQDHHLDPGIFIIALISNSRGVGPW